MSTNQAQKKEKTKAKKRYLKRKKERRKVRNTNTAVAGNATSPTLNKDDGDKGEDEWEDEEIDETKLAKTPTKRPKKKQKLNLDGPDSDDAAPMDVDVDPVDRGSTPSLIGALPSFPLPKHPDAPSKTDLALQGLDKSLVDAEIVWDGETQNLDDIGPRMSGRMKKRLGELGIVELFAVQKVLLPILLPSEASLYTPYDPPPDVCVSAPTGSGKTLAYAIPVIETLSQRIVTHLRALIVVPTRDLVTQVRETMESLSKGTNLKIGTVTGQHSFANEQIGLVGNVESSATLLEGGSSRVDILICTPGRLIDHLEGTPNFTLQHLRYLERLIIDEADKLLAQSFQDWLSRVITATRVPSSLLSHLTFPHFPVPDALSPLHVPCSPWSLPSSCRLEKPQSNTQKLLFSATITSDPGKLKGLGLRGPVKWVVVRGAKNQNGLDVNTEVDAGGVLDVVMERFEVPSTLTEHYIIMRTALKPLVLFYLVLKHGVTNALVFTKSAESTERLMRLFELFFGEGEGDCTERIGDELVVRAYSSDLPVSERKTVLDLFKNRKVHILISSDLISRGIDITHVRHVVSYDAPVDMRKYVHRVGRTARAGREGHAWCLVEEHEARYFKQMLLASDHLCRLKKMRLREQDFESLRIRYDVALGKLKDIYIGGK